jgi:hypothetical protein
MFRIGFFRRRGEALPRHDSYVLNILRLLNKPVIAITGIKTKRIKLLIFMLPYMYTWGHAVA